MTFQMLEQFEWETMRQPQYLKYFAASNNQLFHRLQSNLDGKNMNSVEKVRTVEEEYFSSKMGEF